MKRIITLISLSTILVCLAASAQTQQPASGGGLADRFKQLDRNGDGKLSREEVDAIPWLKAAFDSLSGRFAAHFKQPDYYSAAGSYGAPASSDCTCGVVAL